MYFASFNEQFNMQENKSCCNEQGHFFVWFWRWNYFSQTWLNFEIEKTEQRYTQMYTIV